MMPGKEVMSEYSECSGTQSYNFTRIENTDKPEVREFVKRVFNWDEEQDMVYNNVNYGVCADGNGETFV